MFLVLLEKVLNETGFFHSDWMSVWLCRTWWLLAQFKVPALIYADISSFTHHGFSTNVNTMEKASNILVLLWRAFTPSIPLKRI